LGRGVPQPNKRSKLWLCKRGETIVPSGAAAANALGLTTQVPVKSVYLTSGRSRVLNLRQQAVELRHAPRWQLTLGNKTSGQAVRALAWLGPDEAPKALQILRSKLTETAKTELVSAAPQFPTWLARLVGEIVHCHLALKCENAVDLKIFGTLS
jgi:hypothetical protein